MSFCLISGWLLDVNLDCVKVVSLVAYIYNAIYNFIRNHLTSIDFWTEITYCNKEGDGKDRPNETGEIKKGSRLEMQIVNKGCPITILGIYFDEGQSTFKMHIDSLPIRLERGGALKIKEPFPWPVNREKIEDKNISFYLIDAHEKRFQMKKIKRIANIDQPDVSRINSG